MEWGRLSAYAEPVAWVVILILAVSLIQGMSRGASGSAKHLFFFVWESFWTVVSLLLAARTARALTPVAEQWLVNVGIRVPVSDLNVWQQAWYTFITGLRDLPLMRYGILFLAAYFVYRSLSRLLGVFALPLLAGRGRLREGGRAAAGGYPGRAVNRFAGAVLGAVLGAGRSLVLLAGLFVYVSLLPQAPLAAGIASSPVYRAASERLLQPIAGRMIEEQGPVFTQAVEPEFKEVLQRRYEMFDRDVPVVTGDWFDSPGFEKTHIREA